MIGTLCLGLVLAVGCLLLAAGSTSALVETPIRTLMADVGPALAIAAGSVSLVAVTTAVVTTPVGRVNASLLRRE